MLFYNQLTELTGTQFVVIATLEVLAYALLCLKKWKHRHAVGLFALAIGLSLLSIMFVRGNYGGSYYHENMGWPFQFYGVSRNMEADQGVAYAVVPAIFRFDAPHFLANTFFWACFPFFAAAYAFDKNRKKPLRYLPLALMAVVLFAALAMSFHNQAMEAKSLAETRALLEGTPTLQEDVLE